MTDDISEKAAAGEAIRKAARAQIESGTPPETRATFERLMKLGMNPDQALECIAAVLASEMFAMLQTGQPHNAEHYAEALRALPRMPWEGSEN